MNRKLLHCGSLAVFAVPLSGCAITVQNRYSVFGLDRFQTESMAQAQTWSLIVVGIVSLISMAMGACGFYLVQRLWRWRENEIKQSSGKLVPKDRSASATEGSKPVEEFSSSSVKRAG
jgi:hypothetical protein